MDAHVTPILCPSLGLLTTITMKTFFLPYNCNARTCKRITIFHKNKSLQLMFANESHKRPYKNTIFLSIFLCIYWRASYTTTQLLKERKANGTWTLDIDHNYCNSALTHNTYTHTHLFHTHTHTHKSVNVLLTCVFAYCCC